MKLVRCPRCDHENRAAISVSICDRCGCDISTLPDLCGQPNECDLRVNPAEIVVEECIGAVREEPRPSRPAAAPPPRPPLAERVAVSVARGLLAVAAVALGIAGARSLTIGTALEGDQYIAGSIAILAAASAISGLVMMLVTGSPDRSQGVTLGMRSAGFLLVVIGVWAVAVIAQVGGQGDGTDLPTTTESVPGMMMPPPGMGGPGMGPGGPMMPGMQGTQMPGMMPEGTAPGGMPPGNPPGPTPAAGVEREPPRPSTKG